MKKHGLKFIFSVLMVPVLLVGFAGAAHAAPADPKVRFEGGQITILAPTDGYTNSSLFASFRNVMPGDRQTEEILVENQAREFDSVKVYLRAARHDRQANPLNHKVLEKVLADPRLESHQEEAVGEYMDDFLSRLGLAIWNGDTLIYNSHPDDQGALAENVLLGTLRQGESLRLKAELTVPIELGNEYMDRVGEVDWVFVAEGLDGPAPSPAKGTTLTVRKVWADDGTGRPDKVTVELLRNGQPDRQVQLSQSNRWTYTWDDLDERCTWSVREADIPEGYQAAYSTKGSTTTITNTKNGFEAAAQGTFLIQTGQLNWPIPVLGGLGLLLIGLGIRRNRKDKDG